MMIEFVNVWKTLLLRSVKGMSIQSFRSVVVPSLRSMSLCI